MRLPKQMYTKLHFNSPPLYFIIGLMVALGTSMTLMSLAATGSVSGMAFKDLNRNQIMDAGEEPIAGVEIYLFDSTGRPILHAPTDAAGRYQIIGAPTGNYKVRYSTSDWWNLWKDFAPSTTGSTQPEISVQLTDAAPSATANFGWRPIVRSTDVNAPITSLTTPSGLKINSYNDVVTAQELYTDLLKGSLFGDEAKYTTIRFDISPTNYCSSSVVGVNGTYSNFSAACYITYLGWLDGDAPLFHEYGHAWSLYYTYIVQQDPDLHAYLKARGLDGDARLETNTAWSRREMIAEDYRQLFGSATAAVRPQVNTAIPLAKDVPGLKTFLMGDFMYKAAPPPDTTAPAPPTNLAGSLSGSQINLTWTAATDNVGVTGYDIYRNSSLIASTTTPSYTDSNLGTAGSFSYYVKAKDAANNISGPSNTVNVVIPPILNGTVTNTSGAPLSGLKIVAKGSVTKTVTTDSGGKYSITGLPAGSYQITYSLKSYPSKTITVTLNGGVFTQNVTMQKR